MLRNQPQDHAKKWPPRVVIAAPQGQSGKTTISLGVCAALTHQGLAVQPFKKGPDYIDPSWLTAATGRDCHNLDLFLIPEKSLLLSFQSACQGADLALIEGAMGLYDSLDSQGKESTAYLARLLGSPVILVINTTRMTRSIAAMVSGYQHFEPDTNVAGVILNNVSGNRHESKLKSAVENYCGIPVLGSVPKDGSLGITQRHLGLVPFKEREKADSIVNQIGEKMKAHLDLKGILAVAKQAEERWMQNECKIQTKATLANIGVIADEIFTFYYPENLEALRQAGARLIFINSLHDQKLPDIDGLYIGGGFPEMAVEPLEANSQLRREIARAIEGGLPVYAECAGLMYLSRAIHWQGHRYEMVGALPCEVEMHERPQGHGYVEAEVIENNPFFAKGERLKGHQFHYSRIILDEGLKFAYKVRSSEKVEQTDGIMYNNVLASYTHLHALSVPEWGKVFVSLASRRSRPGSVPASST